MDLSIIDSDEDDRNITARPSESPNTFNYWRKKQRGAIIESGDEDEIVDSSEDDLTDTGRLSPSIHKAIRRSIFNISQDDIVDDEPSEVTPLPAEKVAAVRHKIFKNTRPLVIISDSDKDDDDDDDDDGDGEIESQTMSQKLPNNSDSEKLIEDDNDLSEVIAIAKSELNNPALDEITAQKRAMILCDIQNIEQEKKKIMIFINKGNLKLLPDNGERLRTKVAKHDEKLKELRMELDSISFNKLELAMPNVKDDIVKRQFNYINLTKPTASTNIGDFGKTAMETFKREQSLTVDRLEDLHCSLLSRPTDDTRAEDPRGLRVTLMPHQQHALAWLLWREQQNPPGGVLADDMGLGKTLTMISLVIASLGQTDDETDILQCQRAIKHQGGTLVVCPASLISQWEGEIKNRCKRGLLNVEIYHGTKRETQPRRLARNDVVITTYNILSREYKSQGVIYKIEWNRVILDEAHVIRNHKSQVCESVCGVLGRKRWALTGTPIHNKELDLFALLKYLKCSPFDDIRVWKRWVDNKNTAGHERLAAVMKSLMLRRTKQELINNGSLNNLPEKTLKIMNVTLDDEERLIYEKILIYSKTLFAQFLSQRADKRHDIELISGKYDRLISSNCKNTQFNRAQKELLARHADVKQYEILVLLLRLRQVCCHPSLIHSMLDKDDIEVNGLDDDVGNSDLTKSISKLNLNSTNNDILNDNDDDYVGVDAQVSQHLLTSDNPVFHRDRRSSKLRAVIKLINEILKKHEKIIIVSQWTNNLEILAEQLKLVEGATYKMFTGSVAVKNRQEIIESFNDKINDPQILLLSLTAGGVGLNLVGANHLILIDIHWNPQLESQAQDRIYRFGQEKNVFIYKFICIDTIEERIKNLQDKKLEIASSVLTGTRSNAGSKLSLDDLKSLFSL